MTLTRNGRLTHNQVVAGSSPAALCQGARFED